MSEDKEGGGGASLLARAPGLPPALILLAGVAMGSAMDATIKHLSLTNHVLVVAFGRYLFGTLFSLGIWFHAGAPSISLEMWRAHGLRGAVIAACAVTFFWALTVLPLAEAVTLSFIYPLLAPFMAWLIIGERIRPSNLAAALVGFIGVFIATRGAPPSADSPLHTLGVVAVLTSATLFSVAVVLLRARARTDGAAIVGLMTSVIPGLILAVPACFVLISAPPVLAAWPEFLLMGALAAGFMYLLAIAYAGAEAQQLAPIHYTELIWATLFGFIIFREQPRPEIFFGAVLIIAACIFVAWADRRVTHLPTA